MGREEWYRVLELEPGSDAKAVKRAYFRLVKQYTPEEHPEEFQRIRAAYEALSKPPEETENTIRIPVPEEPFLKKTLELGEDYLRDDMPEEAVSLAEEIMQVYGDLEAFLFLLARAARDNGSTGKCVKAYEKLVKIHPDLLYYRQMLAIAYYDRGFFNKAMDAFGEAYVAGARDIDFMTHYCMCCLDRKEFSLVRMVANELLQLTRDNLKENMEETFVGLHSLLYTELLQGKISREYFGLLQRFIEDSLPWVSEYQSDILFLLNTVLGETLEDEESPFDLLAQLYRLILPHLTDKEARENAEEMLDIIVHTAFLDDSSLSQTVKDLIVGCDVDPEFTAEENRFGALDAQLCFLEQWPELQPEIHQLREKYPTLYEIVREFIEKVEGCSDLEELRGPMLKEFDRKAKWFEGNHFYERYPERRPRLENLIWNSEESGSYRRQQPKVGRNDPCPCGSGKKYKKCCGRDL